jgi:hypothetical protein
LIRALSAAVALGNSRLSDATLLSVASGLLSLLVLTPSTSSGGEFSACCEVTRWSA